jgi:TRAP-type C4-dicarboxylate transport system substrate-binding protein
VRSIVALAVCAITPLAKADPTVLKFGFPTPMGPGGLSDGLRAWAKDVDEKSGGTLKIQFYAGGTVVNFGNVVDRLIDRVVDIGFGLFGDYTSQFPRSDTPSLPFECTKSADCSVVMWRLYAKGVTAPELTAVKPLALFTFPSASMHTTKLVKTADDVKGLKLITTGRTLAQAAILMSAAPVTLSPGNYYQALQGGVANGVVISWNAVPTFKIQEVTKNHLGVPFGLFPVFVFMNKDSYAALPAEARAVIDQTTGEKLSRTLGDVSDQTADAAIAMLRALPGHSVTQELPADEAKRWKSVLAPITEEWVKQTPDGAKVLAAHRAEMAKVAAGQ